MAADPLHRWRERVLRASWVAAVLVGFPFLLSGVSTAFGSGQTGRAAVIAAGYLLLLTLALWVRIGYRIRAVAFVALALMAGMALLLTSLPLIGGILLLGACVFAAMFFGARAGWAALGLGLITWVLAGLPAARSALPAIGPGPSDDPGSWAGAGLALAVIGAALVASLAALQSALTRSWSRQVQGQQLAEEARAGLERRVAETARGMMRQAIQLQTTAEIARLASQKLDPSALLNKAVELIREKFGFYHASAFLVDQTGTWAELAASTGEVGRSLLGRRHRLPIGSPSLVGWASANRLTRVALDVSQDPFYFPNPLLPDTKGEIAVPLLVGERLLGVLDVQSVEPAAFSPDDVRAIEAIAGELAIALESTQELQSARVQLEQAENVVRGRLRTSWSRLARSGAVANVRIAPAGEATIGEARPLPAMALASSSGRTVLTEDGREIAAPILVRGEIVASVGARRGGDADRWTEDDLSLLEAIAGQASLALESARQTAEEQRRLVELEVLNRISQAVSQMLRLDSLFRVVHAQVNQILGSVDLTFAFYDPVRRQVSLPYISRGGEQMVLGDHPIGDDLLSYVIRSQQPLLLAGDIDRTAAEIGVRLEDEPVRSWLGVPMLIGEDIVGAISVEDSQVGDRFTDDDAALLTTIASQVASAFQNSRLLDQVQRSARREHLIREITSKVRRSPDLKTILETTARELGRALNASHSRVRLERGNGPQAPGRGPETKPQGGPP
jgi:GAF domain-containing protein